MKKFLYGFNIGLWLGMAMVAYIYAASMFAQIGNNAVSWVMIAVGSVAAVMGGGFIAAAREENTLYKNMNKIMLRHLEDYKNEKE